MPYGWSKVVDDSDQVQYRHEDDSMLVANKRARGNWSLNGRFGRERVNYGAGYTKQDATDEMRAIMREDAEGMASANGGGLF